MRITDIKLILLSVPMASPIKLSFGSMKERLHLIIDVGITGGARGIGEAWTNFPSFNAAEKVILFERGIIPEALKLEWVDPFQFQTQLKAKILNSGAGRQWGARGHIMQAISGIDIAVWDAYGKSVGKPVYKLLGAQNSGIGIRTYASGLGPENVAQMTEKAMLKGFNAVKVKVGFDTKTDMENLKTARSVLGDKQLYIDVNQGYMNYSEAKEKLDAFKIFRPEFVEEPLSASDLEGLKRLNKNYRIAGGENIYGVEEFAAVQKINALSLWQPDVTKTGGISEFIKILNLSDNTEYAPHMFGTVIGQAASLALMWGMGKPLFMETEINDNPLLEELSEQKFYNYHNGEYRIEEKDLSGIGITLNNNFINKYKIN